MIKFFERLAVKIKLFDYLYSQFGRSLVEREIKAACINSFDNVLHIGCGSLPYTAKIIVEKTGARVTAIDCDKVSVKDAERYIIENNLVLGIKAEQANGIDYSVSEFDVIIVSHGVKPKELILKAIFLSMKDGSKMIYRNPKGFLARFYNNEYILLNTKHIRRIRQKRITVRESILIEKR